MCCGRGVSLRAGRAKGGERKTDPGSSGPPPHLPLLHPPSRRRLDADSRLGEIGEVRGGEGMRWGGASAAGWGRNKSSEGVALQALHPFAALVGAQRKKATDLR